MSAILVRMVLGASIITGSQASLFLPSGSAPQRKPLSQSSPQPNLEQSEFAKLPACAPIKGKPAVRAKSPDVLGAKPSTKTLTCFPKADVDAGKKILNGFDLACFACHGSMAEWNPTVMLSNLRAQGDGTLSLSNISAINNAHLAEMAESVATAKQLKQVRAYLKSKKG